MKKLVFYLGWLSPLGLGLMVTLLLWLAPVFVSAADPHAATTLAVADAHGADSGHDGAGQAGVGHQHGNGVPDAGNMVTRFAYSYLTAYMFCLSLCAASLYLVFIHHLFDAAWSVPVRRMLTSLTKTSNQKGAPKLRAKPVVMIPRQ